MTFYFFYEGPTEEKVLEQLIDSFFSKTWWENKKFPNKALKVNLGKDSLTRNIISVLGPEIGLNKINCLAMLDLDLDKDGNPQTVPTITNKIENALERLLKERLADSIPVILRQYPGFNNLYTFQYFPANFKFALFIADKKHLTHFVRSTMDDYILNIILHPPITISLMKKHCTKYGWTIDNQKLANKVKNEIPELLNRNGIPLLQDAKIYVRFFIDIIHEECSPSIFAGK